MVKKVGLERVVKDVLMRLWGVQKGCVKISELFVSILFAPVAQRIERRFPKPCVGGSSPLKPATYFLVNKKGLALVLIEFELCRLQSSLKLFVLPLKSSTKICCFPLLLALHTLVTLFSFQGAVLVSLETRFKHLAILNA